MFYKDDRLALFIDGANVHAACRALGFDIDYKLLRQEFMRRGKLLRAFYYTALLESEEYSPIRPLVDWLQYNGFTMVTKPAREYVDSQGRRKVKGNMDIELTIDAMEIAPHVDHVVLFSGDGDFRILVETLQRRGLRVSVVSTMRTNPPMISDDLRRQADTFIELDELRGLLGRAERKGTAEGGEETAEPPPFGLPRAI
ncbi:MAG: NYN domain-containing protein [Gemmobacter sp.]